MRASSKCPSVESSPGVVPPPLSSIAAVALGVPLVQHLIYPYDESPPLDDIMSFITSTSIQWGSNPRITSHELTETHYLFFRISCHSI